MRHYLSFGGGVNSTALLLLLHDRGVEFEAVYADHGADWPETREYVQMLRDRGYPLTVLETRRDGLELIAYYLHYRLIPSRILRACTDHYKVKPLRAYQQAPCVVYLGIDAGEEHRAKPYDQGGVTHEYPLVDWGIDRAGCVEVIKQHNLPVPPKSGCFICPFQRVSQWRELYRLHPDLYCKARHLEVMANERMAAKGYSPMFLAGDRPLEAVAQEGQMDMFDASRGVTPCLCGL